MTAHTYHGTQIELDRNDTWRDAAACRDQDPEMFFPHETGSAQPAKTICAGCDVREQCLAWAIDHKQDYGVWGGRTVKERKRLLKNSGENTLHKCQECGAPFHADPRARPKYCPDCRPAVHRRQKQKNQAKRNERKARR